MSEYQERTSRSESDQVVSVDTERLKLVKIVNLSGRTRIVGTNTPYIRVRATGRSGNATPSIELKNEGREVEITTVSQRAFYFNGDSTDFDEAVVGQAVPDDFDEGNEPQPWQFGGDERGREEYRRAREKYREAREEYRERRRDRKEEARRMKEQSHEASRRAKEEIRENNKRGWGFWRNFDFDSEVFVEIAKGIGQTVGEMMSNWGELYVEVPVGVELEVKNVSGVVEISNMDGFCRVGNTSGAISLYGLRGGVQLKGLSGKVEAHELGGRVTFKVTSGSVRLTNCQLTALDLSISSGNVLVETALVEPNEGDYRISSSSGNIQLRLLRGTRAWVDCRTLSGKIIVSPEIGYVDYRNRPGQSQAKIELNGGGRRVTVNAISGNVDLSYFDVGSEWQSFASASGWPTPPPPPPPPGTPRGFGSIPPIPPVPPTPGSPRPPYAPPPPYNVAPGASEGSFSPMRPMPPTRPTPPDFVPPTPQYPVEQPQQRPLITPPPPTIWPSADETSASEQAVTDQKPEAVAEEKETELEGVTASVPNEDPKKSRQLEILRAIERGELSVEEGMARLGELDD